MSDIIDYDEFNKLPLEEQKKITDALNQNYNSNLEKTIRRPRWSQNESNAVATTLEENSEDLDQLLPINDSILKVPGHTLDLQVEGKSIYAHLAKYKEELLSRHSNNIYLIKQLPQLIEKLKQIKIYLPAVSSEEQEKKPTNRTIITGEQESPRWDTKTGVPGLKYLKDKGYTQDIPELAALLDHYQRDKKLSLSEEDVVKLFVIILGLPMAGSRDDEKNERKNVGKYGIFMYAPYASKNSRGLINAISFSDLGLGLWRYPSESGCPSLTKE